MLRQHQWLQWLVLLHLLTLQHKILQDSTTALAYTNCQDVDGINTWQLWPVSAWCIQNVNFSVVVTEGRPDNTGIQMARALDALGVPVTMVLDSGVAYALER